MGLGWTDCGIKIPRETRLGLDCHTETGSEGVRGALPKGPPGSPPPSVQLDPALAPDAAKGLGQDVRTGVWWSPVALGVPHGSALESRNTGNGEVGRRGRTAMLHRSVVGYPHPEMRLRARQSSPRKALRKMFPLLQITANSGTKRSVGPEEIQRRWITRLSPRRLRQRPVGARPEGRPSAGAVPRHSHEVSRVRRALGSWSWERPGVPAPVPVRLQLAASLIDTPEHRVVPARRVP